MSKHTEEPWYTEDRVGYGSISGTRINADGWVVSLAVGDVPELNHKANAARIVACINALAGIDDPEAFMLKVRELWDDNEVSGEIADVFDEHLKGATK